MFLTSYKICHVLGRYNHLSIFLKSIILPISIIYVTFANFSTGNIWLGLSWISLPDTVFVMLFLDPFWELDIEFGVELPDLDPCPC